MDRTRLLRGRRGVVGFGPLLVMLAALAPAHGQIPAGRTPAAALANLSTSIEDLAQAASPAVVRISVRSRAPLDTDTGHVGFVTNQESTGSGVIVDSDGFVVTNAHVVTGAHHIDVSVMSAAAGAFDNHQHFEAKILGVDRDADLALLKIEAGNLPTLSFLDSDKLRQGQIVIALGSPLGLENSLTVGYISSPIRHLTADRPMFYIQTDAAINPGNSGGPLLDISGHIAASTP